MSIVIPFKPRAKRPLPPPGPRPASGEIAGFLLSAVSDDFMRDEKEAEPYLQALDDPSAENAEHLLKKLRVLLMFRAYAKPKRGKKKKR